MLLSWCHLISLVLSHWCQLRFRKNNDWYSKCAVFGCNNTKNKEKDLCVHTVPNINIHETACKINSAFSWVELNLLDSNPHATQRKSHFFKNVLTKSETFSLRDLISSSKAKLLSVSISTISSAPSAVSTCKPLQNRLYYNSTGNCCEKMEMLEGLKMKTWKIIQTWSFSSARDASASCWKWKWWKIVTVLSGLNTGPRWNDSIM